jgi:hypothetical protein
MVYLVTQRASFGGGPGKKKEKPDLGSGVLADFTLPGGLPDVWWIGVSCQFTTERSDPEGSVYVSSETF